MKKILFPTDFSDVSHNAFVYALHLAKKLHAEIVTLHVYTIPVPYGDHGVSIEQCDYAEWSHFENYKKEVDRLHLIAEQQHCGQVKLSHKLESGDVVLEILGTCNAEAADIVVLGTTGATGLKEAFLGSVAEKIVNQAKAIVLAIPEKASFQHIKNILFVTELDKLQVSALVKVQQIAKTFGAHIDVLQVKNRHDESDAGLLAKWKSEFVQSDIYFYILTSNDVEGTVTDFMKLNNTDVVAMPVHHKGFFEKLFFFSLSRQMAFHSHVPVLAVHTN